jgi:D-proline reductase (dithiol) PrdB
VGLIARVLEEHGISTVVVFLLADIAARVGAPRGVLVRWPFGHPLGEPGNAAQQMTVIRDALLLLAEADRPGIVRELPYRWRRETWSMPADWGWAREP